MRRSNKPCSLENKLFATFAELLFAILADYGFRNLPRKLRILPKLIGFQVNNDRVIAVWSEARRLFATSIDCFLQRVFDTARAEVRKQRRSAFVIAIALNRCRERKPEIEIWS